jgi:hypothetical protein
MPPELEHGDADRGKDDAEQQEVPQTHHQV